MATTTEAGLLTWTSSNPAVATVNAVTGEVTANISGTTTISYTSSNGKKNSIVVVVYPPAMLNQPYYPALQLGESTPLFPIISYYPTVTNKQFTTSLPGIVNVDSNTGQVTAIASGTAFVTYVGKDMNNVVIEKGMTTIAIHPAAATGLTPIVPAPSSVIGWGTNPTGFTVPQAGQTIRWYLTNGTGTARINVTSGAVGGLTAGDVSVMYKITDNATGIVLYKSAPVAVLIPNTPRVNTSAPYVDGGTIPSIFSSSTNVNLTGTIMGENGALVSYSNPRSSDSNIATATITLPNPTGHVFLNVTKVGSGPVNITFDYTDIHGTTGTMTWTFNFQ